MDSHGHTSAIAVLAHPLDPLMPTLAAFLQRVYSVLPAQRAGGSDPRPDARSVGAACLAAIRTAADADAAGVVDLAGTGGPVIEATSGLPLTELGDVLTGVTREWRASRRDALGFVASLGAGGAHGTLLAVPLGHGHSDAQHALLLLNPSPALLGLGEPLARLLAAIWTNRGVADPGEAQLLVLTALRRQFGRLPLALYQHALRLYRRRLEALTMVFEPVVSLNRNASMIGVASWEALARRGEGQRSAPAALLDAAAVWGDEFVIERDIVLTERALRAYVGAHTSSPFHADAPRPLSINVAVRSVLSEAYATRLARALDEAQLSPGKLILEISEKDPIAPGPDEIWLDTPMTVFGRRLTHLASTLHVGFAVDDFGVGHASLDRISALTLTQIKVDRVILAHPLALEEIGLVVRLAKQPVLAGAPTSRDVVMEGFDGTADVSLEALFNAGIELVQGYITEEPATTQLRPLGEVRTRIASLLGVRP